LSVSRREVAALLERWRDARVNASGVKEWVAAAGSAHDDAVVREVLAELDLLEVYLLTPEDVPALLRFLDEPDLDAGLAAWSRYRDAIDLDARSRQLKRDRFYRPFCR
jgi:hypothetical protein